MLTAEELFKLLSTIKESNIEYRAHFLMRLKTRAQVSDVIPKDAEEIQKIILNSCPTYVDYQGNNEFKVFYNISEKYNLVIILSLISTNPTKIKLIT